MRANEFLTEKWSQKYKSSINCSHPKGFSQRAHCAGKKKHNESHDVMEHVCPDCGMCQTHGTLNEIKKGAKDSNGYTSCWKGYHAAGTKKGKNGKPVRNCVSNESVAEAVSQRNKDQGAIGHGLPWKRYDDLDQLAQDISDKILTITNIVKLNSMAHDSTIYNALERYFKKYGYPDNVFNRVASIVFKKLDDEGRRMTTDPRIQEQNVVNEDWNKVNHHDKTNGLSQKAVNAYRREHPGSKLKTAVTTKPSKLKPGSKAAKRRKSFCARMSGNKGPMKKPNGKPTPKALALRRWHCESLFELFVTARKGIYEAEGDAEGLKHLTPHLARDILNQIEKEGVHAIVKSIEWGDGGAKELIAMIKRDLEQVAGKKKTLTPNDIHTLADSKGVAWDNEPSFLQLTKRLTGQEHLDDLDQTGLEKVQQHLENLKENFADGRHPEDKGDAKRHGINTKASVSSLRKTAKQGGRKGQLAHWLANMKAGRAKK